MALQIQIGMDEVLAMEKAGSDLKYEEFKEKFKPKKTTDDCYTPELVYDAVADWVAREYHVDRERFVRPFWPGADYESDNYPDGCIVVDNPPFSILAEIIRFYDKRNVDVTYLAAGCDVTYANGAEVKTSFITNLDSCRVRTCPELFQAVERANNEIQDANRISLPKYEYPDEIVTAAIMQRWTRYGIDIRIEKDACVRVSALDAQKAVGKAIFGGGSC